MWLNQCHKKPFGNGLWIPPKMVKLGMVYKVYGIIFPTSPSGKLTVCYWKLPSRNSHVPMKNGGSFHRFLYVYQRPSTILGHLHERTMARRWHACEKALKAVSRHLDRETFPRCGWPRFPRDDVKIWSLIWINPESIEFYFHQIWNLHQYESIFHHFSRAQWLCFIIFRVNFQLFHRPCWVAMDPAMDLGGSRILFYRAFRAKAAFFSGWFLRVVNTYCFFVSITELLRAATIHGINVISHLWMWVWDTPRLLPALLIVCFSEVMAMSLLAVRIKVTNATSRPWTSVWTTFKLLQAIHTPSISAVMAVPLHLDATVGASVAFPDWPQMWPTPRFPPALVIQCCSDLMALLLLEDGTKSRSVTFHPWRKVWSTSRLVQVVGIQFFFETMAML